MKQRYPIPPDLPKPALGVYKQILRLAGERNAVVLHKAESVAGMVLSLRNGVGSHIERELVVRELRKLGLSPAQVCPDVIGSNTGEQKAGRG